MVNPVTVLVEFLTSNCPALEAALQSVSPVPGWQMEDHIQGGNDLPVGWRVDQDGPVILIEVRGGGFPPVDVPLIDASVQLQVFAVDDETARGISGVLADCLHERGAANFTYARLDMPTQVIPDRTTDWRIGINYYTVRVRNT